MNLQEIKTAIKEGKTVFYKNLLYKIIESKGYYYIKCNNGSMIGLEYNGQLQGEEKDFHMYPAR